MPAETYAEWVGLPYLPERLWIEAIQDDCEGFRVVIRTRPRYVALSDSSRLRIVFRHPNAYRWFGPSKSRLPSDRTLEQVRPEGARVDGAEANASFFVVAGSHWVETLHLSADRCRHYVIVTEQSGRLEVVTSCDPVIGWIDA